MTYEQAEKWEFNPFDLTKVCTVLVFGFGHVGLIVWHVVHVCMYG